jgi:hypothetical protein
VIDFAMKNGAMVVDRARTNVLFRYNCLQVSTENIEAPQGRALYAPLSNPEIGGRA